MKNLSFKTPQYAIVKRTLNLEEFMLNYMTPSQIQNSDLNPFSTSDK
ncbi:hypothetical protein [Mariniflexile sp.]